jgi:DNA modification methylase
MKPMLWNNCYDSSWKGLITEASFAHPAKFARGLIERIYDHCLAKGYLKRGDLVADVFGGIGTGGITAAYRGLNWLGCELEPKFVAMAQENFRLHRHGWSAMRGGNATIIQGDSRKFDEHVAGIVSSPPYAESLRGVEHNGIDCAKLAKPNPGRNSQAASSEGYGASNGQIGSLKSGAVEAVISSPPFTQGYQGGGGINKNGYGKAARF